jgi:hypothetical protein
MLAAVGHQHSSRNVAFRLAVLLAAVGLFLIMEATAVASPDQHVAKKGNKEEQLEILDVSVVDLAWGLVVAAGIGAIGGLIYAALTNPPPDTTERD